MKELEGLNMAGHAGDVLGDAYEYLIGQFASESGKKAGEFYTPQPVAKLMTQIVLQGKEDKKAFLFTTRPWVRARYFWTLKIFPSTGNHFLFRTRVEYVYL